MSDEFAREEQINEQLANLFLLREKVEKVEADLMELGVVLDAFDSQNAWVDTPNGSIQVKREQILEKYGYCPTCDKHTDKNDGRCAECGKTALER